MNECTTKPYRAYLPGSEQNHHAYAKAHALAYSVRELGDEVYLVWITVMLPGMRILFQHYFGIVYCVWSLWDRYNLIRTCALSNKLSIFRCWAYLITAIPETRRANWIWYLRFVFTLPKWCHVFMQDSGGYISKCLHCFFALDNHLSTLTFVISRLPVK